MAVSRYSYNSGELTHFWSILFYTPWKYQKISFIVFLEDIKWEDQPVSKKQYRTMSQQLEKILQKPFWAFKRGFTNANEYDWKIQSSRGVLKESCFEKSYKFHLTHFSPESHFYTSWKRQKTKGFQTFSGGKGMWHWTKTG